MARQVLENGVILPAEYSDDWYDDMTSNLTKLDDVIGSDSEKLSSADVGAAALSNSYNDLDNLPTIPTVNDATLTIQKNGVDVQTFTANASSNVTANITVPTKTSDLSNDSDFVVSSNLATVATSGDYDDLSNKPSIPTNTSDLNNDSGFVTLNDFDIPSKTSDLTNDSGFITSSDVPTKTSDLTNDSNFVDTSNSAVASGITSAKVTSYDSHIADTDIHVTTADKTKWNNGVTQSYVLRYASTSVTPSSTISYSVLNNTDNIKAGDSVIDASGQVFLIASVDSVNETVTVSAVLLTLALDANVMHLSGYETVAGIKTFSDIPIFATFDGIRFRCAHNSSAYVTFRNANQANPGSIIFSANDGNVGTAFHLVDKTLIPYTNGDIDLGTSLRKWKSLNGLNPGSLSLPDLNNGVDISGYLNTGDSDNSYTPLVDGYISVRVNGTNYGALYASQGDVYTSSYGNIVDVDLGGYICSLFIPVVKNVACRIVCRRVQTIVSAKFFPCLGNV